MGGDSCENNSGWSGPDRRNTVYDNDWHSNKTLIMRDLDELKRDTKEIQKTVTEMKISLITLQTKIMTVASMVSIAATCVAFFVQHFLIK